ncbi:macrophage scavenger receptor types I and II-like [Argopecten irradians]|uniref:macrophage scavenger receptor types I and II-like n=1 Tax=Argopecten irradians TaxID=31199 RepID=UPI003711E546
MKTSSGMAPITVSFVIVLLLISIVNATTINNQVFDDNKRQVSFLSSSPYGLTQCLKSCSLDGRCVSINYHPETYTCEMVETNANAAPDQTGWLFTSDLSLVAGTLGPCKDVTLQEYDVCVVLKSGSNSLVTKYCPEPPSVPNGYVTPGHRTVGDTATVTCGSCYNSSGQGSTCLANGQWSTWNTQCTSQYDIRLMSGLTEKEGRVEILYNGAWGTVCDDEFGTPEAIVVCNQLGYSGGEAFSRAHYGEGSGEILMDELECTGTECGLSVCQFPGWGVEDCSHGEDAGVKCT